MIIMGVDLGHARTGLSLCDELEMLASPLCVVEERSPKLLLQKVADAAKGHRAQLIVVGLPRNMDGSEGESAQYARDFAQKLKEASGIPVDMRDERGTTISAYSFLNSTDTQHKKTAENHRQRRGDNYFAGLSRRQKAQTRAGTKGYIENARTFIRPGVLLLHLFGFRFLFRRSGTVLVHFNDDMLFLLLFLLLCLKLFLVFRRLGK